MLNKALIQLIFVLFTCSVVLAETPRLNMGPPTFSTDGSTVSFPLTLSNVVGVSLSSVGTTLRFDQTKLGYSAITTGPAATASLKDAFTNNPVSSPVIIGVAGYNANSIGDGVVATVAFTVKFAGNETVITNAPSGADLAGNDIVMTGTNGVVLVDTLLKLIIQGTGGGSVNSSPTGIHCTSGTCQAYYYPGAPVTLTALPSSDSVVSWSDACAGCTGVTCNITATGGDPCGVLFSLAPLARIGATGYDTLQAAYDAAADGAAIMAREYLFPAPLTCKLTKSVSIKGGYNQPYASQTGYTAVTGLVTIGTGAITVDRIVIR